MLRGSAATFAGNDESGHGEREAHMENAARRIAVIDGNSLMHRAFHAVPTYMMAPDGTHTNAVFGFVSMLVKMIEEFSPDAVICAFDAGIPQFRFDAIQKYKAQRPPTDPDLKEQFPLIEELLGAMNIPVVKLAGWEGDDILGTLAARGDAQGVETLLVTGDRDAFQLASEHTRIVATKKGLSDVVVYGPDEVKERYGIGPELVPDYIALKGDPSDNIPGVPGIGEKTAAKLLQQYGSAEGIVEHAGELKGKTRTNIEENMDVLFAGRQVATIVRDLDLDIDLDSVEFPSFDPDKLIAGFHKIGINAHVSKLLAMQDAKSGGAGGEAAPQVEREPLELIAGDAAIEVLKAFCDGDGGWASAWHEVTGTDQLFGSSNKLVVGIGDKACVFDDDDSVREALLALFESCSIVCMDAKELLQVLVPKDSAESACIDVCDVDASRLFDLTLAAYLLDSSRSDYGIEYLAYEYLGERIKAPEKARRGQPQPSLSEDDLVLRVDAMLRLREAMDSKLDEDSSKACYRDIDMPLVPVLVALERAGLEIDVDRMHELSAQLGAKMDELSQQVYDLAGETFNIASPKQLSHILFEKLGLPAKKKTRSGYSTDASVLSSLASKHPVPGLVLEYRELSKIKSTYLDTLPLDLRGDNRIHTTFNQTIAATGRLSSSDPNLQNIPVRTELGRQIRTAFVPYKAMRESSEGAVFLSADYSQIELRLLAQLSGDQGLIDAFRHGSDFHASTAASIFGISVDEVTPDLRSRAKAVNFGIVYGQQAFGLSRSLSIPVKEAQGMIDRYFEAYPDVKVYLDSLIEQARSKGYVETMFGRKRHVPEVLSSNAVQRQAGERVAMNHPMQGSAADIIKMAMVAVARRLHDERLQSVMMLQIHDELDFSCPMDEVEKLSKLVKEEMEGIVSLDVPMSVSVSYGPTWADAK